MGHRAGYTTGVVNLALRVNPFKAVAAAMLVLRGQGRCRHPLARASPEFASWRRGQSGEAEPRELEVRDADPRWLSNKEIARKLVPPTSERTVDTMSSTS